MAATSKYRARKKKRSQATTEIDHDAATSKPHRMLNKTEKSAITKLIADLPLHVLETEVQTVLIEHVQIKTKQMLYDILAALLKNVTLWKSLIDHHRVTLQMQEVIYTPTFHSVIIFVDLLTVISLLTFSFKAI